MFNQMTRLSLMVIGVVLLAACAVRANRTTLPPTPAALAGDYDERITVDSASHPAGDSASHPAGDQRTRTYRVHIPPAPGHTPLPLVIVLHGGGGNDDNAARMTGMSAKADRENFIVVYPDGSGRLGDKLLTWNSGNCCGYAAENNIDDVGFIRALIGKLQTQYPIDAQRIYVTGMSNGAMMAHRLACEASDLIAAIGPVAGALNVECQPARPVAVIAFNGMQDKHVLFQGGAPQKSLDSRPRVDTSVADTISFWVKHNRCQSTPLHTEKGNILRDEYGGCAGDASVVLYTIKDGGHAWPGGQRGSLFGDGPTQEISATDLMWEFFKQHARPQP